MGSPFTPIIMGSEREPHAGAGAPAPEQEERLAAAGEPLNLRRRTMFSLREDRIPETMETSGSMALEHDGMRADEEAEDDIEEYFTQEVSRIDDLERILPNEQRVQQHTEQRAQHEFTPRYGPGQESEDMRQYVPVQQYDACDSGIASFYYDGQQ